MPAAQPLRWSCFRAGTFIVSLVAMLAAMLAGCVVDVDPAAAQINVLAPAFSNLNGAAVWGSQGVPVGGSGSRDDRPLMRWGFAAFYGPFGGRADTAATHTRMSADSTDSTGAQGIRGEPPRGRRRAHSAHSLLGDARPSSAGKVMLLLGYQHSAFYHFGIPHIPATLPVGGVLVTTLLGPYPLPLVSKRWSWYGGVGGTIARLTDIAMRADTVAVQFSTERTLAPEAVVMLMYNVAPSYRVFLGTSYQYLRFGSVTYRAVESGQHIPAATLQRLPESMELQSLHFSLGFSFSASGLMLGR